MISEIQRWQVLLDDQQPRDILQWAARQFPGKIVLASALGPEAQILTHLIARSRIDIPVFTIDTGRLFNETHDLIHRTNQTYHMKIKVFSPDALDVEDMVNAHGPNLFLENRDLRKRCCVFRKVMPLQRALAPYETWITGMRREQSVTRAAARVIDWDEQHQRIKLNPLVHWTADQIWDFIRSNNVPHSTLHEMGFPSIGCAPCTRAVETGEDPRSGRWWWEEPEQRECGIHIIEGRIVRQREPVTV